MTFIEIILCQKEYTYFYVDHKIIIMKLALITTCTNRKRIAPAPSLMASNLHKGNATDILQYWTTHLEKATNCTRAMDLYCGRGFTEVRQLINKNDIQVWVISAGTGLTPGDLEIPAYNLTILPTSNASIQQKIKSKEEFTPSQWWNELNRSRCGTPTPILDTVLNHSDTLFIISVSSAYVGLISNDLFLLKDQHLNRIRITGLNSPGIIPAEFQHLWMPYDDRFDGPHSPNPGTRADFPQRVSRHFIEEIYPQNPQASPSEHSRKVSEFLKPMPYPVRVQRETKSNEVIKSIIKLRWSEANGSGAKMLRILRDEEKVACEQGRFAELFKQVKARMV